MWLLYEFLLSIAFLLYLPRAIWRRRLPHRGWSMRLGRYPASIRQALEGRSAIWVHAVSVGEVLAARPLLEGLSKARAREALVVSTVTPSGFQLASTHQHCASTEIYFPLDLRICVTRALEAIRPRVLLLMESELWPVMISTAKARGVSIAVINGRISPRAFRRYQWVKPWLQHMMSQVDLFLMQTQQDAERVITLGAPRDRIRVIGSLKWDASVGTRPSPDAIRSQAARIGLNGQDPVLVAGSTHRGEEELLLRAFKNLRRTYPHARCILAPRHLERLGELEFLSCGAGFVSQKLSQGPEGRSPPGADPGPWDVGLVDTFGQLPLYYGMASVVFVGGSLIPHGGQNPLEPASLGKPVVFGPSMHNFAEIAQQLLAHRAARQLKAASELPATLQDLLGNRPSAEAMGRRAQDVVEQSRGTTQRTLEALQPLLKF